MMFYNVMHMSLQLLMVSGQYKKLISIVNTVHHDGALLLKSALTDWFRISEIIDG